MQSPARPRFPDYILIAAYCAMLFGYAAFGGRPLTMHEARLPETSREMLKTHGWLLPTSGGRPWLERPPLPHWVVTAAMWVSGHDDRVWVVRLPSGLMGSIAVLLTTWIAGRLLGRDIGIISGLVLATSFEFYSYSCLAEDDIYLGALVAVAAALFVKAHYFPASTRRFGLRDLITSRSPAVTGFFFVLGLTNLTKGPLLGLVILGTPIAIFLIWDSIAHRSLQPILRFMWLWGWLITVALTLAWPLWAYHRYPDVLGNWRYDYLGRMSGTYTDINESWYYYLPTTLTALLPWTPACLIGLIAICRELFTSTSATPEKYRADEISNPQSAGRTLDQTPLARLKWDSRLDALPFFLCWGIVPLMVLSIPKGKHHHYLIPLIAPWAVIGAIGLREVSRFLFSKRGAVLFAGFVALILVAYSAGQTLLAGKTDHTLDDTAFLIRVRNELPANIPLFINGKLGPVGNLDFFRVQFYSRTDARLLHNLSYLRDQNIINPQVYVITRARDESKLRQLGIPTLIDQSPMSHDMPGPEGRFSLFLLTFDPKLARFPLPPKITSLQAMERADGPWCGPKM